MKNAGSSKGKFLPSDVPRNHVQKLILNIATATVGSKKDACTTAPPHHPSPGCRGEPIFQTLPALRQHSYTIPSKKQDQRRGAIAGKGHVGQRRFPAGVSGSETKLFLLHRFLPIQTILHRLRSEEQICLLLQ